MSTSLVDLINPTTIGEEAKINNIQVEPKPLSENTVNDHSHEEGCPKEEVKKSTTIDMIEDKENEMKLFMLQSRIRDLEKILRDEEEAKAELLRENQRLKEIVNKPTVPNQRNQKSKPQSTQPKEVVAKRPGTSDPSQKNPPPAKPRTQPSSTTTSAATTVTTAAAPVATAASITKRVYRPVQKTGAPESTVPVPPKNGVRAPAVSKVKTVPKVDPTTKKMTGKVPPAVNKAPVPSKVPPRNTANVKTQQPVRPAVAGVKGAATQNQKPKSTVTTGPGKLQTHQITATSESHSQSTTKDMPASVPSGSITDIVDASLHSACPGGASTSPSDASVPGAPTVETTIPPCPDEVTGNMEVDEEQPEPNTDETETVDPVTSEITGDTDPVELPTTESSGEEEIESKDEGDVDPVEDVPDGDQMSTTRTMDVEVRDTLPTPTIPLPPDTTVVSDIPTTPYSPPPLMAPMASIVPPSPNLREYPLADPLCGEPLALPLSPVTQAWTPLSPSTAPWVVDPLLSPSTSSVPPLVDPNPNPPAVVPTPKGDEELFLVEEHVVGHEVDAPEEDDLTADSDDDTKIAPATTPGLEAGGILS